MTVNYHNSVWNGNWRSILRLLFRWRGSILKAVMWELLVWLFLYYVIYFVSHFALSIEQMSSFQMLVKHCDERMSYIPLDLILGFYVKGVVSRYDEIIFNIGSIDNVAFMVATHIHGASERARMFRRTIVRYCVLGQLLSFRNISIQVKKRLPTLDTVVASGFMMKHEKDEMLRLKKGRSMYWLPLLWAMNLTNKAFDEGFITNVLAQNTVAQEVKNFRRKVFKLRRQNRVPIPLAYPQLVYFAVHVYFLIALIARQYIVVPEIHEHAIEKRSARGSSFLPVDFIIPWMGIIEFVVYYSWMTVAMHLLNPFGEDDDDFETNWLLDKNLEIGMKIVDQSYASVPPVKRDLFFDKEVEAIYSEDVEKREAPEPSVPDEKLPEGTTAVHMVTLDVHGVPTGELKIVPVSGTDVEVIPLSSPRTTLRDAAEETSYAPESREPK